MVRPAWARLQGNWLSLMMPLLMPFDVFYNGFGLQCPLLELITSGGAWWGPLHLGSSAGGAGPFTVVAMLSRGRGFFAVLGFTLPLLYLLLEVLHLCISDRQYFTSDGHL